MPEQDPIRNLSGKAAIGMAVIVLLAVIAFQAFGKHLEIETWMANMVAGAFLTVTYFYWRKGKDDESAALSGDRRCFILHIEDNPVQRKVLSFGLKRLNLDVDLQAAATGEEALEYLTRSDFLRIKPDIIVLDLALGSGMTGQQFLEKIKQNPDLSQIPVIILSSTPRDRADRPDLLDTCRFYIDRGAGLEALKEAILSCDPRNAKSAYEDLSMRYEEIRKINHDLRQAIAMLMASHNGSDAEWQQSCKMAQLTMTKATQQSGRWRAIQ